MTSRRGNTKKTGQKYQNSVSFKNDLHDTSKKTKTINSLQITNVCQRCKDIIDWKIKYKKYKPRTCPGKCLQCSQKNVMFAYHTRCTSCAQEKAVCAKCGEHKEIVAEPEVDKRQQQQEIAELENGLKGMSLRERRAFLRQMEREKSGKVPIVGRTGAVLNSDDISDFDDSEEDESSTDELCDAGS